MHNTRNNIYTQHMQYNTKIVSMQCNVKSKMSYQHNKVSNGEIIFTASDLI